MKRKSRKRSTVQKSRQKSRSKPKGVRKATTTRRRLADRKKPVFITAVLFLAIAALIIGNIFGIPGDTHRVLTDEDVIAEMRALDAINSYPNNKFINSASYPRFLGIYQKNGMPLTEVYFCSDVCPDYGRVIIIFENVTQNECNIVGGKEYIDPAWHGYVGCIPDIERFTWLS
jgi:hypothetical protein